jgi:hypothetical protein
MGSCSTIYDTPVPRCRFRRAPIQNFISAQLGDSSITVTLDRYGNLFPSMEEALGDQLDAAFITAQKTQPEAGNVTTIR